ncbi:MAG TPA: GNAT family N-acetyltransferase [Pyrinomonadaceae bacterium]|nr:GNAT family N-acetyltransferase [Pyrinomonadaceae bacterium]
MSTLETECLVLRMFRDSDTDAYADMVADPEVMRFFGGQPASRAEAWRNMAMIVGHWQLRGYGMWAVEERASGEMVGRVGCWRPEGWPGVEVGWTLRRAYWGRGFATEAARASLDYAFEKLNQTRVISLIAPENVASIRVAERIGEVKGDDWELFGKKVVIYGIDRDAWATSRADKQAVRS